MNLAHRSLGRKILLHPIAPNHRSQDAVTALSNGSAASSPALAHPWNNIVIGLRRHTEGRIVNGWLVLIVLVGAVVAVADGLTRVPIFDRIEDWYATLEYVPYEGAFLFAGLTLPLMFVYACKARATIAEGLFLWFVLNTTAYTRDFSYIRWPGTPFFVTDIVLLFLLFSIYLGRRQSRQSVPLPVSVLLVLFLGAGAVSVTRGFLEQHEAMLVLRDSALAGYSLFLLVGYHLLRSWLSIKRAAVWFLLGTALSTVNGFACFIAAPQERRFIPYGIYVLISLVGVMVGLRRRLLQPRAAWALAGVLWLGLMLANARSLFISLGILVLVVFLSEMLLQKRIRFTHSASILSATTILVMLTALVLLRTESGRDFAKRSSQELASGVLNPRDDPNWQFRLSAWKESWKRFEEYPLAGEGFGVPFVFDPAHFDSRPHNTFLTVLYKMGLIGFLPLLALLSFYFASTMHAIYWMSTGQKATFLKLGAAGQLAFCIYGTANLALESPFLASLFWLGTGVGLRMTQMLDFDTSLKHFKALSQPGQTCKRVPICAKAAINSEII